MRMAQTTMKPKRMKKQSIPKAKIYKETIKKKVWKHCFVGIKFPHKCQDASEFNKVKFFQAGMSV